MYGLYLPRRSWLYVNHGLHSRIFDVIESITFKRWVRGLRDRAAVARINARLRNVSLGNIGDTRAVGSGLFEMRIHHGPGYRLLPPRGNDSCCAVWGR